MITCVIQISYKRRGGAEGEEGRKKSRGIKFVVVVVIFLLLVNVVASRQIVHESNFASKIIFLRLFTEFENHLRSLRVVGRSRS